MASYTPAGGRGLYHGGAVAALGIQDLGGAVGAVAVDDDVQDVRIGLAAYRGDGTAQAFDIIASDGDDGYLHLLSVFGLLWLL